jgi:tyrosinase
MVSFMISSQQRFIKLICRYRRQLSKLEKSSYIGAVKCIMGKPPVTSKDDLPGARNHYDDFVGTHIAQTPYTHFVVSPSMKSNPAT